MGEIKIEYLFDNTTKSYIITIDKNTTVEMNIENDIDFTEFVKILTLKLESKKKAVLIGIDDDDPKRVIVLNTIREIVKSYNATMEDYLKEIVVFE